MKNIAPLAIGGVLIIVGVVGVIVLKNIIPDSPGELIQQEQSNQKQVVTGGSESIVNIVTETPNAGVPLPTEEDIIRTFFVLIDEDRPSDAVLMMSKATTGNDSYKQAWAVQFNAFKSAKLTMVEASDRNSWTDTTHVYRVEVKAEMKPESANEVMPYFGWENGENTRWVELVKEDNLWKVAGIGTGP